MSLNQKHILVITSVYPLAVTTDRYGSFIHETLKHLQPTGATFSVFAPAFKGQKHQTLEGISVYRFRYCIGSWETLTHHGDGAPTKVSQNPFYLVLAACYIFFGACQLLWHCLRTRPDLLHVNWPFPHGLMALPVSKFLGIPMVFTFHGAELLLAKKFGFIAQVLRWLLPTASSVTANSSFTQHLVHELYSGEVTIIPYGLTIKAKAPCSRPPDTVPRLLYVGRLLERKGVRYLLAAMPEILEHCPVNLRVVGDGVLAPQLKSQCRDLGIDAWVDFLGFVPNDDLAVEYSTCDVFVLPAIIDHKGDTEGLGIVMIEALAHCKPVVASAVGGIIDVVLHNQTGLLVPPQDPHALATSILRLINNPPLAQRLGQQGLVDVQQRFSWFRISKLWEATFSKVFDSQLLPDATTVDQSQ